LIIKNNYDKNVHTDKKVHIEQNLHTLRSSRGNPAVPRPEQALSPPLRKRRRPIRTSHTDPDMPTMSWIRS